MGREKSRGKVKNFAKVFDGAERSQRAKRAEAERTPKPADEPEPSGDEPKARRYTVPKSPAETPSNEPKLSDDEPKVALGKVKYVVSKNKATKDFSVYESNVE